VRVIVEGRVLVNGFPVTNPASLVGRGDSIRVVEPRPLRGAAKLRAALARFAVQVAGRVALDLGAAVGGFTSVLLEAGAARVYAVDAGHGQLLGSLRADPRVVNLEGTNLGTLSAALVPDPVDLVTVDLSYLALAAAVPQLEPLELRRNADLVALVKPQFELALGRPPRHPDELRAALAAAVAGVEASGWRVRGTMVSPVRGARGSVEFLLHARRA
jgi:23S rRNA (cytidine1920-2'-O)/16S rRNA (cytidine1409-2'-O)-methyltransferase